MRGEGQSLSAALHEGGALRWRWPGIGTIEIFGSVDLTTTRNHWGVATLSETTLLLDPKGQLFNQAYATSIAKPDHLILICGHYEGVDARMEKLVDNSVSIGHFVLTGGEIPAMVITDTVTRLVHGVLKPEAIGIESYSKNNKFEYPQYTRPPSYKGMKVPEVLLSGNHEVIRKWKKNH